MLPEQRPGLIVRDLDEEKLILDLTDERIHRLNVTASFIWNLCDGEKSSDDIVAEVVTAFDVPHETAVQDVERTIKELQESRLITCK